MKKDPYETKGLRRKLNLGHTLGHILESAHDLPHGQAVLKGILFSAEWSFNKNLLSLKNLEEIKTLISLNSTLKEIKKISSTKFKKLLERDKKRTKDSNIDFVFIKRPEKCNHSTRIPKRYIGRS